MPVLNVVCPICTDVFRNSEDIHSTSCGHLFHLACMNDWQRREASCPQCRSPRPTTHKLYLSFDESVESTEKLQEMEIKLKSSNDKIAELLGQIGEAETNFMQIQEQFTLSEKSKHELEGIISELKSVEDDFLRLQGQYTESSELVRELEDRVQQLFIENECKSKELKLKSLENESLKATAEAGQNFLSDSILSDKIKVLEQKLKHISSEFEKEITTSTQLSIDNMKLEGYIKHLNSCKQSGKKSNTLNRKTFDKENAIKAGSEKRTQQTDKNRPNCVFIKDLPLDQITIPLENVVVKLASKMNLSLSPDDLIKVNLVHNKDEHFSKTELFVQFKSRELKDKFTSNKDILKTAESIVISDCTTDTAHTHLMNNKKELQNGRFRSRKNNNFPSNSKELGVAQGNVLQSIKKSEIATAEKLKTHNIDEYLYQL